MSESIDQDRRDFDHFLAILAPDRENAAREYERLRRRLVRFFEIRGSSDPNSLADETLARVVKRLDAFELGRNVLISTYMYGFAKNIFLEDVRRRSSLVPIDGYDVSFESSLLTKVDAARLDAIERCLAKMPDREREILLTYYSTNGNKTVDIRERLAVKVGCTLAALHTRVSRLRQKLASCVSLRMAD